MNEAFFRTDLNRTTCLKYVSGITKICYNTKETLILNFRSSRRTNKDNISLLVTTNGTNDVLIVLTTAFEIFSSKKTDESYILLYPNVANSITAVNNNANEAPKPQSPKIFFFSKFSRQTKIATFSNSLFCLMLDKKENCFDEDVQWYHCVIQSFLLKINTFTPSFVVHSANIVETVIVTAERLCRRLHCSQAVCAYVNSSLHSLDVVLYAAKYHAVMFCHRSNANCSSYFDRHSCL